MPGPALAWHPPCCRCCPVADHAATPAPRRRRPQRSWALIPALLGLLALFDLRVELQLLSDHFTLTALATAIRSHPLAVAVLLLLPSLLGRYRQGGD